MTERKILTLKTKPKTTPEPENITPPAAEQTVTATATIEKIETPVCNNTAVEFISLAELHALYPNAFFIEQEQRKPLMIGITDKILEQNPQWTKKLLSKSLRSYCFSIGYLQATLDQSHRIDLDGQPVAELTPAEKANAAHGLASKAEQKTTKPKTKPQKKATMSTPTVTTPSTAQATARAAKITFVLDAHSITRIDSTGQKQIKFEVRVAEMTFNTELNSKSYRKALATLDELGADNCTLILQGSMPAFGKLEGVGLVVQPKKQKQDVGE